MECARQDKTRDLNWRHIEGIVEVYTVLYKWTDQKERPKQQQKEGSKLRQKTNDECRAQ